MGQTWDGVLSAPRPGRPASVRKIQRRAAWILPVAAGVLAGLVQLVADHGIVTFVVIAWFGSFYAPTAAAWWLACRAPQRLRSVVVRLTIGAVLVAVFVAIFGAAAPPHQLARATAPVGPINAAAADRAALNTLMTYYDKSTGRWTISTSGWWSSAVTLSTMIAADRALGVPAPSATIARTYDLNIDLEGPDTTNHYRDDTAWFGEAWLDAYEVTGELRYLHTAEVDDAYVGAGWTGTCGGGVDWAVPGITGYQQKNAITNSLYLDLSARLYTRTHQRKYLDRATSEWQWLSHTGLIGRDHLVLDHLDTHCQPTGVRWSYNQGGIAAALLELDRATGHTGYLTTARQITDAATTTPLLNRHGILTDPCEPSGGCVVDGATFKDADELDIAKLNAALPDHPYDAYLTRQATTAYRNDRLVGDKYGLSLAGPPTTTNSADQATAVAVLTAALQAQR